jgi:hypothetical protein
VWQVLRQIRQHAIRAVGLLSDSDTARAALVAKIDVMLIELGLLRDRLRVADASSASDVRLVRHCPGGLPHFIRAVRPRGWIKISPDPDLIEKIRDLAGLYLSPPLAAAVYAVDEKAQIQALNRSAPILPMLPTTPQKATHDYVRNGTLDLFAALEVATGEVITDLRKSHTAADFIAFLNKDRPRGHRRPRRSAHRSVQALAQGIRDWVETWNDNP